MNTNLTTKKPIWFEEYTTGYLSGEAHGFILHGDIYGIAHEDQSHRRFLLSEMAKRYEVVLTYDRARGITFADESMRAKALELVGTDTKASDTSDQFSQALATIGTPQQQETFDAFSVSKPIDGLMMIEKLLRAPDGKSKVAVIIEYADAICPPANKSMMQEDNLTILVMLQTWARDMSLGNRNNPFFLMTRNLVELHPDLRSSAGGYKAIEIPLPNGSQRLSYVTWYLTQREEKNKPIPLVDIDQDELGRLTAGLSLRHIEDILLLGAKSGGVTRNLVKSRKDAIIKTEFSEVAEMIDPLPGGFQSVGGMEKLIAWCQSDVIDPIRKGNKADPPKGVLLVGPPGSGKTYLVQALAWEIGFNAVALNLENILGSYVGDSEKKLQQFFSFVKALAPVLVFLDELDQSDVSRRGNNSGNPVASNLFSAMLRFMGDQTLRGEVIFFFASNRPDLIDPALMRFGRIDAIIPVLLANETARLSIVQAQARAQTIELTQQAAALIAARSIKYSGADIAAVVSKARKLCRRRNLDYIDAEDATLALKLIKPATPKVADYYTLLAVQACNDAELLPEEEGALLDDPKALQVKIKEATPVTLSEVREERT